MTGALKKLSRGLLLAALLGAGFTASAQPQPEPPPQPFRSYILSATQALHQARKNGGYNIGKRFTRDLRYGAECCLQASRPIAEGGLNPTMCVAAVAEVIVEALNEYGRRISTSFNQALPLSRWNGSTRTHVIPNIFMYAGADSAGTAFALQRLGLGREKPFQELLPGDFINFSRVNGTGHAVIHLGFLRRGGATPVTAFAEDVVGFRYFSAQGKGRPDAGFGYRNAYFVNNCPTPRGRDDDCNIIGLRVNPDGRVIQTQRLFNTGEMFAPPSWRTAEALADLRRQVSRGFEDAGLTRGSGLDEAVEAVLSQTLAPDPNRFVDGSGEGDPER